MTEISKGELAGSKKMRTCALLHARFTLQNLKLEYIIIVSVFLGVPTHALVKFFLFFIYIIELGYYKDDLRNLHMQPKFFVLLNACKLLTHNEKLQAPSFSI